MIKAMNGWKVINSYNRKSLLFITALNYPVNVEVKPTIQGSKLFFFKKYEDAEKFCAYGEMIVPCIARNVTKPKYILSRTLYALDFWNWKNKHPNRSIKEYIYPSYIKGYMKKHNRIAINIAPKGTYWADSITCLK